MTPEFSRIWQAAEIGEQPRDVTLEANAGERAALARRFAIPDIALLTASARLQRRADGIHAEGRLSARVTQNCVATGDPVKAKVDEPFALRFVEDLSPEGDEIELDADDCDTIAMDGGAIDLGEAVAETLALALDPWPRAPHADQVLSAAGISDGSDVGPFAALKALKGKSGG